MAPPRPPLSLGLLTRQVATAPDADALAHLWQDAQRIGCAPTGVLAMQILARAKDLEADTVAADILSAAAAAGA